METIRAIAAESRLTAAPVKGKGGEPMPWNLAWRPDVLGSYNDCEVKSSEQHGQYRSHGPPTALAVHFR